MSAIQSQTDPNDTRRLRYFVSYAHADMDLVNRFDAQLRPALAAQLHVRFEQWRDIDALLPGDVWFAEIEQALRDCDFGLLLVSNQFLASDFIRRHELPALAPLDRADSPVACIPVSLEAVVSAEALNVRLGGRQVFSDTKGRSFADCAKPNRVHFVNALVNQILQVVNRDSQA